MSRAAVVLSFDAVAYVAARAAAHSLLERGVDAGSASFAASVGPLAPPGAPGSLAFPIALFAGLVLAGSYSRRRVAAVVPRLLVAVAAAAAATAVVLATLLGVPAAASYVGAFGLLCFGALAGGRAVAELFLVYVWPRDRGSFPAALLGRRSRLSEERSGSWGDYSLVAEIPLATEQAGARIPQVLESVHGLVESHGVDAVIVEGEIPDNAVMQLVDGALDVGCRVIYPARAIPLPGLRPRLIWFRGEPFFEVGTPVLRTSALLTKRVMDVIGAGLFLLLAAPLMVLIGLAIRLDSPGPVFFSQDRAGLGGRRFRMLKFRTMTEGADEKKHELAHMNRSGDVRLFKILGDPRVTRVGRFLRPWSFDELPQLINVLRGEMSLVGPRPFFESDFAAYEDRHFRRLDTKPGITGLWQVSGRSEVVDFEDVVFLDRQYIEQWSVWLDLSILARTVPAVMRRTGAY